LSQSLSKDEGAGPAWRLGREAKQGSLGVEGVVGDVFLGKANTQGLQEGQIVPGEGAVCSFVVSFR
jgi:hypothetical protein